MSNSGAGKKKKGGTWQHRKDELVELLQGRSGRAKVFLHEGSTQEEVVHATIAELERCALETRLLETKLQLLQERKQKTDSTGYQDQPSPSSSSNAASSIDSSQSLAPWRPPETVYRDYFRAADVGRVLLSPSFRILDCNEVFLNSSPAAVKYAGLSINEFIARNISFVDLAPPALLPFAFRLFGTALAEGQCHMDEMVISESPRIALDVSIWITFDDELQAVNNNNNINGDANNMNNNCNQPNPSVGMFGGIFSGLASNSSSSLFNPLSAPTFSFIPGPNPSPQLPNGPASSPSSGESSFEPMTPISPNTFSSGGSGTFQSSGVAVPCAPANGLPQPVPPLRLGPHLQVSLPRRLRYINVIRRAVRVDPGADPEQLRRFLMGSLAD